MWSIRHSVSNLNTISIKFHMSESLDVMYLLKSPKDYLFVKHCVHIFKYLFQFFTPFRFRIPLYTYFCLRNWNHVVFAFERLWRIDFVFCSGKVLFEIPCKRNTLRTTYIYCADIYLFSSSCDIVYLHMVMEKENMAYYSRVPW